MLQEFGLHVTRVWAYTSLGLHVTRVGLHVTRVWPTYYKSLGVHVAGPACYESLMYPFWGLVASNPYKTDVPILRLLASITTTPPPRVQPSLLAGALSVAGAAR